MNTTQEIRKLVAKVAPERLGGNDQGEMVAVQSFLEEQEAVANAGPEEIVAALNNLKSEALKLGQTPLGLKYYTEARLMESTVLPLVNESIAAQIEERMIELQRKAVTISGAAMKSVVQSRNKQLEELHTTNKSLSGVSGGLKGLKRAFKKINDEQKKLFDTVGAVSFSSGQVAERGVLESVVQQWKKDLSAFSEGETTNNNTTTSPVGSA